MDIFLGGGDVLSVGMGHKPGDPPPSGYGDWHEWAAVQTKAGLKQDTCPVCGLYKFPQELSERVVTTTGNTRKDGRGQSVMVTKRVCLKCDVKDLNQ